MFGRQDFWPLALVLAAIIAGLVVKEIKLHHGRASHGSNVQQYATGVVADIDPTASSKQSR
jgi:uncharacterized membrane protein YhaH (DUF805 family)